MNKAGNIISILGILCMGYGAYSVNHEYSNEVRMLKDSLSRNSISEVKIEYIPQVEIKTDSASVRQLHKQLEALTAQTQKCERERDNYKHQYEECLKQKSPVPETKPDSADYWKKRYQECMKRKSLSKNNKVDTLKIPKEKLDIKKKMNGIL